MKFLLLTFLCLLTISAVSSAKDAVRLNVVSTNGIYIESLHSRLHSTKSHLGSDTTTDTGTKKLICHYVNTSQSLPQSQRQPIYLTEIYDDLQKNYSKIFSHLYQQKADGSVAPSDEREMVYTNKTKMIAVTNPDTKGIIQENVFVCLERKKMKDNKKIFVEYFVSEEYNVSDDPARPNNYIAGRFIFKYNNDADEHPVVEALAEEPATALFVNRRKISQVEFEYRKRRYENERKNEGVEDSLCSLDEKRKARICNLIFNSAYFDGELRLQEVVSSDQHDCREQTITFRTLDGQVISDDGTGEAGNEEWMFNCAPKSYDSSYVPPYWISRAYGNEDEVFVYRTKEDHSPPTVQLENLFKHVRLKSA